MRHWVGISFVAIVLIGATISWCIWPDPLPQATASVKTLHHHASAEPDVQMVDMHLMAQIADGVILQVVAKRAISSGVTQHAILHEIQAKIQQHSQVWNISATRGIVDRVTGDMTAQGGVRLYDKEGYVIETEKLSLHAARRVLQTDTAVMMHGNAVFIAGIGLRHEIDKNRITLQRRVKASFHYDREARGAEGKGRIPLDAFAVNHRGRPFDHGTTRAEPNPDTVTGH